MLLVAGLGNPGPEYARNRHNVGFMAADAVAARFGFSAWKAKFSGALAEGRIGGEKVLLLKPQTYMNLSGRSVGEAVNFHKLEPECVLVLHDEIDLDAGKVRLKAGGGLAGHNGLKDIKAHIGADFRRLRFGIGHPGDRDLVTGYVLNDFTAADKQWLKPFLAAVADNFALLVEGRDSDFMSAVAMAAPPPPSGLEPGGAD
jgi:PTH1 family peptidyl-tRNA hydrolase